MAARCCLWLARTKWCLTRMNEISWCTFRWARARRFRRELSGSNCDRNDGGGVGRGEYGCAQTVGRVFGDCAKMVEILYEAGIPKQALQFVTGLGEIAGDALVKHAKTRFVAFTGSKDVGLLISEAAGKRQPGQLWIKRAVLEMGGKDATIVDEEADVEQPWKA